MRPDHAGHLWSADADASQRTHRTQTHILISEYHFLFSFTISACSAGTFSGDPTSATLNSSLKINSMYR
jgi:hypothetical protein